MSYLHRILPWVALPLIAFAHSPALNDDPLAACPGYKATNVKQSPTGLTADLTLAGKACNVFGTDLNDLVLDVSFDTGEFGEPISLDSANFLLRHEIYS